MTEGEHGGGGRGWGMGGTLEESVPTLGISSNTSPSFFEAGEASYIPD